MTCKDCGLHITWDPAEVQQLAETGRCISCEFEREIIERTTRKETENERTDHTGD